MQTTLEFVSIGHLQKQYKRYQKAINKATKPPENRFRHLYRIFHRRAMKLRVVEFLEITLIVVFFTALFYIVYPYK